MSGARPWRWLGAILFVACGVRLVVWWVNPYSTEPKEDSRQYHTIAWNLAAHGVMSQDESPPFSADTRRVPGYPAFLSVLYYLRGAPDVPYAKLVQCLLGAAAPLVVYFTARQAGLNDRVALVAALLTAVSPPIVLHCDSLTSDWLLQLVLVTATVAAYRWCDSAAWGWGLLCGGLWSVAAMVKPESALLPVAVIVPLLVLTSQRSKLACQFLVFAGMCCLVVAGWMYRVHGITGKAALEIKREGDAGAGLLRNYRLRAENGFLFEPDRFTYYYDLFHGGWEEQQAAYVAAMSGGVQNPEQSDVVYWLTHPGLLAKYSAVRFWQLMMPCSWSEMVGLDRDFGEYLRDRQYIQVGIKGGMLLLDASVTLICIVGWVCSLHPNNRRLWIISATVGYYIAVYSLLHGLGRYRVPFLPLMLILGAWWVIDRYSRWSARQAIERREQSVAIGVS